jgi:glyoxylase I family protein
MFTIKSIDHIVLRTNKIKEMITFYCDILGCKIEKEQPDFGLTQLRVGENIIDLLQTDKIDEPKARNLEHFCLRITPFDYEKLKQYFQEKGIEVARYGNRYGAQGYGFSFYLRDPENNEIELVGEKVL